MVPTLSPPLRRFFGLLPLTALCAGLAAAAGGCGGAAPTQPLYPTPIPQGPYQPQPYQPQPYQPQPTVQSAAMTLYEAQMAFLRLPGYHTSMQFMQRNGQQVATGIYDLTGVPPYTLRIDIQQGTGAGTKLLWTGGPSVQVRPSGLLSLVTVNLSLTDNRIESLRGYDLSQTNIYSLLRMAADSANRAVLVPASEPLVEVTGPHLLAGCSRMFAAFQPGTMYPQMIEFDDASQMVVQMNLSGFAPDPSPSLSI